MPPNWVSYKTLNEIEMKPNETSHIPFLCLAKANNCVFATATVALDNPVADLDSCLVLHTPEITTFV